MITQAEKARRQRAYDYVIASCELEGCIITNDVKNLYRRYVNGELSMDEVSAEIDKNLPLGQR